ncbi:DUF418 domain-containing protein [Streptomyces roseifaciens]|uniref:DUF418 domain-containing protein n=1 Tax=Streptomyces roseifaciens TaxID=1488406 RepID=UPI003B839738
MLGCSTTGAYEADAVRRGAVSNGRARRPRPACRRRGHRRHAVHRPGGGLPVVACRWWLERHAYGPVEWGLRAWTNLSRPTWRTGGR